MCLQRYHRRRWRRCNDLCWRIRGCGNTEHVVSGIRNTACQEYDAGAWHCPGVPHGLLFARSAYFSAVFVVARPCHPCIRSREQARRQMKLDHETSSFGMETFIRRTTKPPPSCQIAYSLQCAPTPCHKTSYCRMRILLLLFRHAGKRLDSARIATVVGLF